MRKLIGVALLVCMASMLAMAGEAPKPEVYGGYQFTSTDGGWHASGWNTAANMYIWKGVGATSGFRKTQAGFAGGAVGLDGAPL